MRRLLDSHRFRLVLATLGVLAATWTAPLQELERAGLAAALPLLPDRPPTAAVTLLRLAESTSPAGFDRGKLAALVRRLTDGGARTIGLALPLDDARTPPELPRLAQEAVGLPANARNRIRGWLRELDTDRALAQALERHSGVVLAAPETLPPGAPLNGWPFARAVSQPPERLINALLGPPRDPPPPARMPLPLLVNSAAGVGLLPAAAERFDAIPLGWISEDRLIPGFALRVAMQALAHRPDALRPGGLGSTLMGDTPLPVAPDLRVAVVPAATDEISGRAFASSSSTVRDRTVLVIPATMDERQAQQLAGTVAALIGSPAVRAPGWFFLGQRGAVVAGLLLLCLLPGRWRQRAGLLIALGAAALLVNTGVIALLTRGLWLPVTLPALYLLAAQATLHLAAGRRQRQAALEQRTGEALCALAESLTGQGRLDQAFARLGECPAGTDIREPLYQLALEFERRRQFGRALAAYDRIAVNDASYRDIADRRARFRTVTQQGGLSGGSGGANATTVVVVDDPAIERPVIGRYHIESELGRGAMGVVYRGVDPKIGRKVAIKCLAFTQEYEGRELEEVQQRFRREAEAAGRLDHPNVVTVYDVGEEHDLAYIAMDYIEGGSLEGHTHPDHLLPVDEALEVAACVADALDYAHVRKVVHRDIKPGNIMFNRESGLVKVTDFGIARLTDDSKTRSGAILGSPAYMSPEQVAGKRVDGRSDLFSLGTTLYQLLTGELPFTGDSVTNVMYRILNERPKPLRRVRPAIPTAVSRAVGRALHKDPRKRYQTGAAMAEALRRCV